MNKFGFIVHPLNISSFNTYFIFKNFIFKILPEKFRSSVIKYLPPYKLCSISNIRSTKDLVSSVDIVLIPLLPVHIATMQEEKVLKKIEKGVKICKKNGAKIVGLGALTSVVGNEGEVLSKRLNIPITSGNTLTASLTLDGIYKAAYLMGISLPSATVAIIGATGDIGSICTKILSKKIKKLNIAARNEQKLQEFASTVSKTGNAQVEVFKYSKDAVIDADIILTATSSITTIIDPSTLKPGAVLCDISIPANVAKEIALSRNDILVFEGGLAKIPFPEDIQNDKTKLFLPMNSIFGCIAETMILAFENKFETYSIGRGNITEEKIEEIKELATKHGIAVSDFFCSYKMFTEKDIENIRKNAEKNRKKVYATQR